MISRLCAVLEKVPWLRNRFFRMKRRMFLYYPRDEETVRKKAFLVCLKIWTVFLAGIVYFLWSIRGGYVELCLAISMFYMLFSYILSRSMEKEQRELLKELAVFLGELRIQYSSCRRIEEALEEAIDRSNVMMTLHGKLILDCLDDDRLEERYITKAPLRFLSNLLIVCKSNFLYGDHEKDGTSVFLSNIGMVKESVEGELLKRKETEYLFSGLLLTCILPIGAIPLIEMWAVSNLEGLKVYYYGTFGMVSTLGVCIMTLCVFEIIRRMRYEEPPVSVNRRWLEKLCSVYLLDRYLSWQLNLSYKKTRKKHRNLKACGVQENVKQFLLLQYITALVVGLVLCGGVLQYRNISRNQILIRAEKLVQSIDSSDESKTKHRIVLVEEMVKGRREIEIEKLRLTFASTELKNNLINKIQEERENWKHWKFPWYMWLIPLSGAWLAYHLRYRLILIRLRYTGLKREEELLSFQGIIMCLMYADRMNGQEVTDWLEKTAVYFRDSIEQICYQLGYQNYEEMEEIKNSESYVPMAMILEGILACDKLPVCEAFYQMESDYRYTTETYRQESSQYVRDKSAVSRVLAFAPLYLTIGVKLIVPFVLEGISQLASYGETMQQWL